MDAGQRVRLVDDPGRLGVFTGRTTERSGRTFAQVAFPDRNDWVPLDQIEEVRERGESPIDLFRRGRLARPSDLYRSLTHIRLSGRLANFIYSLETTDTDFYAYQFKPVLKLLQSASTAILIADEVGLGKTIEAGLIWTELRSRFDLQRLLVVCPAMLRRKWVNELQRRFGVKAQICDASELVEILRAVDARQTNNFAVVTSLQGLRPPADWDSPGAIGPRAELARLLSSHAQEEPLVDLLIVDEAHYLRNPETRSFELGSLLRRTSQFAVLLSATPVHLRSDDLFHLLRIVDEGVFNQRDVFEFIRQANEVLVSAKETVLAGALDAAGLRQRIADALRHPLLHGNRQLEQLLEEVDSLGDLRQPNVRVEIASRLESANLLGFAVSRTRRREVKEWRAVRKAETLRVQMNEVESEFYRMVTETVREYCSKSGQNEGFLAVMPQRQAASCMAASLWAWSQDDPSIAEALYEDLGLDLPEAEPRSLGPLTSQIRARAAELGDLSELARNDTKYARLRTTLSEFLAAHPRQKLVLFSSFRSTLRYLSQRLQQDGISCALLLGGDPNQQLVLQDFAAPSGPAVLLSSEVGSEGIDLQFAWVLVNYDLPWNPMKVEQRIGRLDRLGQESPTVSVWNLVHAETIDERIYDRLLMRLGIFERTLGGLEVVLGPQIADLTRDLMQQHLSAAQEKARIDQTAVALENVRRNEEVLEQEAASLVAYGDYILQQVEAARSLSRRVKAEDAKKYMLDYLAGYYPGCRFVQDDNDPAVVMIDLSPAAKSDLARFLRDRRSNAVTALTRSDPTPVRCRFDNRVKVAARSGEEIINQFHPVIRFVAHGTEERGAVNFPAVAARVPLSQVPAGCQPGRYRFAVTRWTFEALRISEQLWFGVVADGSSEALSDQDAERFVMAVAEAGDDWAPAGAELDLEAIASEIEQGLLVRALKDFERHKATVEAQNEDRATAQLRSLDTHLRQQRMKYEGLRDRHLQSGNRGLALIQETYLERLKARIEREREAVERKRQLHSRAEEVCVGVVTVS